MTGRDSPVRIDSSSVSPSRISTCPSATIWSPAWTRSEVADDDVLDAHLARGAVPDDRGRRRDERREAVERVLRPHLLDDPDRRVEDEDPEEERVLPLTERDVTDAERRPGSG